MSVAQFVLHLLAFRRGLRQLLFESAGLSLTMFECSLKRSMGLCSG
jgi:hypothetical protein